MAASIFTIRLYVRVNIAHVGGPRDTEFLGRGVCILPGHVVDAWEQVLGAARSRTVRCSWAARESLSRQVPAEQSTKAPGLQRLIVVFHPLLHSSQTYIHLKLERFLIFLISAQRKWVIPMRNKNFIHCDNNDSFFQNWVCFSFYLYYSL